LKHSVSVSQGRQRIDHGDNRIDVLIEAMPDPVFYKSSSGRYLRCNEAFAQLLGTDSASVIDSTDFDLFPKKLADKLFGWDSELLNQAAGEKGPRVAREFRLSGVGGNDMDVVLHHAAILDEEGSATALVGTIIDVTSDRKTAKERAEAGAMAAAAEAAIQTIEGMIDPVIILDREGHIERVNRGFIELFGMHRQFIGLGLQDVFASLSAEEARRLLEQCSTQGRIRDMEAHIRDSRDTELPVLVNISLLRDSQHSVDGFVLALRDVSVLMDASRQLRKQERALDAILNASEDAVFLIDSDGVVKTANRAFAERIGQDSESPVGSDLYTMDSTDLGLIRKNFVQGILTSRRPSRIEYDVKGQSYSESGYPVYDADGRVSQIAFYSYDVTYRKQGERLQRALYSISEAAYFAQDLRNLFRIVHRIVGRLIPAETITIVLYNQARDELSTAYKTGMELLSDTEDAGPSRLGHDLLGHLIRSGRSLLLRGNDIEKLRDAGLIVEEAVTEEGLDILEWIGVPLRNGAGAIIGAISASVCKPGAVFKEEDRKILSFVSSQIGMAIERKRTEEELRSKNVLLKNITDGAIFALAKAVEMRDPYTAGHQQRAATLSIAIARELNLDTDRAEGVRIAALLHDVGKIAIPSELLSKPGSLSTLEFELIRQHPIVSEDILASIEFPYPIARFVRGHHEKINGSGYPDGLQGNDIPLESRIICVADVIDAMASHRPYRPSRGLGQAMEELEAGEGILYDTEVVRACRRIIERGELSLYP